jgi:hypothetical protein
MDIFYKAEIVLAERHTFEYAVVRVERSGA